MKGHGDGITIHAGGFGSPLHRQDKNLQGEERVIRRQEGLGTRQRILRIRGNGTAVGGEDAVGQHDHVGRLRVKGQGGTNLKSGSGGIPAGQSRLIVRPRQLTRHATDGSAEHCSRHFEDSNRSTRHGGAHVDWTTKGELERRPHRPAIQSVHDHWRIAPIGGVQHGNVEGQVRSVGKEQVIGHRNGARGRRVHRNNSGHDGISALHTIGTGRETGQEGQGCETGAGEWR